MMVIKMLKKRIISSIIGIIILVILVFSGSFIFFLTVSAIALLGLQEYWRMLEVESTLLKFILNASGVLVVFNSFLLSNDYRHLPYGIILFIIIILLYSYNIYFYEEGLFVKNISYQFFGLIYIAGGLSFAIFLRDFTIGPFFNTSALWFVLIATWLTDSGAYFIGMKFGKKAMAPVISPNKTVAGAVGGIATSVIFILSVTLFFDFFNLYWLLFSLIFPLVAIMGDLFESCLKRDFKVKDTGSIIPGHGGILDRFDSFIFTAPLTYYFLYILMVVN
ncbi:phosphatidate cytidylyltransferase [Halanaerobium sp. Z-7514]|uniref:Phosphatidate cytidylyltransferase n=1 Tax=Halanaerobium polyolivorans TaxID=2886943 RepID=A0AAW4WYB0_9FIRM|nr:phosphatidate cytidylyltransferase [Halanaerobium polyolivorans]MCC3143827.1 phosphatidate cytidylyltransferase [Halanaerobium polyolivorans]